MAGTFHGGAPVPEAPSKWVEDNYVPGRDDAELRDLASLEDGAPYRCGEFVEWQYRRNPAGPARVRLARDRATGTLAGQFVVLPLRIRHRDRVLAAGEALNVLTHPGYRRQGIFVGLAEAAFSRCHADGLAFTLGFPNPPAYEGYMRRMGFVDAGRLPLLVRPLRPSGLIRRHLPAGPIADLLAWLWTTCVDAVAKKGTPPGEVTVERVSRFPEGVDVLDQAAGTRFAIMGVRDAAHLNWRFCTKPSGRYDCRLARAGDRVLAYAVGALYAEGGVWRGRIADALSDGSAQGVAALEWLVAQIVDDQRDAGAEVVTASVPPHAAEARAFRRAGFFQYPMRLFPNGWVVILRAHTDAIPERELYNLDNWYLTFADSDTT